TAPATEPHSRPTEATTSGVRSAVTPSRVTCETPAICTITVARPRRPRRTHRRGGTFTLGQPLRSRPHLRALVGGGRAAAAGEDLDEVHPAQVGEGANVDALELRELGVVGPRHHPDRDVGREQRL